MTLDFDKILNLTGDNSSHLSFMKAIEIPEDGIRLLLNDRPEVWLNKGVATHFFLNAKKRYKTLAEILGFLAFINGQTDELINYHYSLYPIKTTFDFKKIGTISLVQLKESQFENFIKAHTHQMFDGEAFGLVPKNAHNFPTEHRLLVATKFNAKRLTQAYDSHLFFDKLHDIYRSHNIALHFLQHFSGKYFSRSGCISSDSFPNAGSSGSSKFHKFELGLLNEKDFKNVENLTQCLEPYLFYRLLFGSEIHQSDIFPQVVLLRAILDPFFNTNKQMIETAMQISNKDKTEVQAKLIFKSLANNSARYNNDLTLLELVQFLKIRNSFIHPAPTGDITALHIVHEKGGAFRMVVYEFILTTFLHNITNGTDLFAANTSAQELV